MKFTFVRIMAVGLAIGLWHHNALTCTASTTTDPTPQERSTQTLSDASKLDLTEEQKVQLARIEAQTRSQLEALLTPTQLEQLKIALKQDTAQNTSVFATLNLTPDQQTILEGILQVYEQQVAAILTPSQLEQLRQQPSLTPLELEQMRRNIPQLHGD